MLDRSCKPSLKLVLDYPVKYTEYLYGDITFVLAHLYRDNLVYKGKINQLKKASRPLMLDNGAWEFGKSMNPKLYLSIINILNPDYAVIPDVFKNKGQTEKLTLEFLEMWKTNWNGITKLMFAPQGETIDELVDCYNNVVGKMKKTFFDILAIPKHVGMIMNRVVATDILHNQVDLPFTDVHFLGYWNWEELSRKPDSEQWKLVSIDTKAPVKYAFGTDKFTSQMDYYLTERPLDEGSLKMAVDTFKDHLMKSGR